MSSQKVLCVNCGRVTTWEELVPVTLLSDRDGVILSGVCGGCAMDVDVGMEASRKTGHDLHVHVRMQERVFRVVRR